jgi:putative nucleotidyltransferase with HDIG domain
MHLWQHSVAVGLVAKGICRMTGHQSRSETAFLGGLLHDVGKIALDRCFPEEYAPVVAAIAEGRVGLEVEMELLGLTHAEVGGLLAAQWNFPDDLVQVIRHHHTPQPGDFLSCLVYLCDLLVRTRIPNGPADETMAFVMSELPAFQEVFGTRQDLDLEHITFSIDDELDHATAFVQLAFQD